MFTGWRVVACWWLYKCLLAGEWCMLVANVYWLASGGMLVDIYVYWLVSGNINMPPLASQ